MPAVSLHYGFLRLRLTVGKLYALAEGPEFASEDHEWELEGEVCFEGVADLSLCPKELVVDREFDKVRLDEKKCAIRLTDGLDEFEVTFSSEMDMEMVASMLQAVLPDSYFNDTKEEA